MGKIPLYSKGNIAILTNCGINMKRFACIYTVWGYIISREKQNLKQE